MNSRALSQGHARITEQRRATSGAWRSNAGQPATSRGELTEPKRAALRSGRSGLKPAGMARSGCACGGACPRCSSALRIGAADDRHEREADRIAARVVSPRTSKERPSIDRIGDSADAPLLPADTSARIAGLGAGEPLPAATRRFFEGRLGADLSGVRLHVGAESAALNRALDARAFTVGQHVALGAGEGPPQRAHGLLAHELVHTLQQRGAPARVQRVPRVANMQWPVNHGDVAMGNAVDLLTVAIGELGVLPDLAHALALVATRRSQWASKQALYVRAVDFLRDHRGRFEIVDSNGHLLRRVYDYCDHSTATLATLNDAFYEQLLVSAVYAPEPGAATIYHPSTGTSHEIPGRSGAATDFAPSAGDSLLRQSTQPDTTVSGGFAPNTDLLVSYGAQSGSVAVASVRSMLGRYSGNVPARLRPFLERLGTDPTLLSVLQRFLADDRGRFSIQPVGMGGAHYTRGRPPSIEVDADLFPGSGARREATDLGLRTTLLHELYHYALDRADAMVTEVGGVDDHNLIQIVEDRYRIVEIVRAGLTPVSPDIQALSGWIGGDPKPALSDFIRRNDHAGLRSYVQRYAFLESLTYTLLIGTVSSNAQALQRPRGFLFDPAQITDMGYLAAINAVILRKAFEVAAYTADHYQVNLAAAWTHAYYRARMESFILRLVGLASQNRTRGVVALAATL